jgi:hypothetical protein
MAFWALPDSDITIPVEASSGVATPSARNDAIFPFNAGLLGPASKRAFAGVSVGRNGVVVYEHANAYFAPILVWPGSIATWTHVAIVYAKDRPTLYLNGRPVREGLQSSYRVHPSPMVSDPAIRKLLRDARIETGLPFVGELGPIERLGDSLDATEVAALARVPLAQGAALPLIALERAADGGLEAQVTAGGAYRGRLADGRVLELPVAPLPPPIALDGPWEVAFPPAMDVPARLVLDRLIPWTGHGDPMVRSFSGTAAYTLAFEMPASWLAEDRRVFLDLGEVESVAEVVMNARPLGTLWKPPFVVDVTAALQPRRNSVSVRVTNTWWNRLIAANRPDSAPAARPREFTPRLAFPDTNRLQGDPVPSGLMGPVRLRPAQRVRIPFR